MVPRKLPEWLEHFVVPAGAPRGHPRVAPLHDHRGNLRPQALVHEPKEPLPGLANQGLRQQFGHDGHVAIPAAASLSHEEVQQRGGHGGHCGRAPRGAVSLHRAGHTARWHEEEGSLGLAPLLRLLPGGTLLPGLGREEAALALARVDPQRRGQPSSVLGGPEALALLPAHLLQHPEAETFRDGPEEHLPRLLLHALDLRLAHGPRVLDLLARGLALAVERRPALLALAG
mmetsp:Transcript_51232/g.153171  ORF Transcript_51232/g.153171 Transcript_51232/m.153171 type:complete len:230 (+) Transcript_51232:555-1244(+)